MSKFVVSKIAYYIFKMQCKNNHHLRLNPFLVKSIEKLRSISVGTTANNVTNSWGFDFKTGSITTGTEVETNTKYSNTKNVVITETTYNIDLPKLAEVAAESAYNQVASTAHNVASYFNQAASSISSGDVIQAMGATGSGIIAGAILVTSAILFVALTA